METLPRALRPERVIMMGLELDQDGEAVWEAVDALAASRAGRLLEILGAAPPSSSLTAEIWARVISPERIRALVDAEDFEALDSILERLGAEAAGHILDLLTESDSLRTRRQLFARLAALGPEIAPEVVRRSRDKRWYARRNMLALMGEFDEWPRRWSAAEYCDDAHPAVRREAFKLMLRVPDLRDRALCGLLADGDNRAVALGLAALADDCPPEAVPLLEALARDETLTPELRVMAARSLGMSGDPAAARTLVELASRKGLGKRSKLAPKSPVMLAALQALSSFPGDSSEAARLLARAAKSGDSEIRGAALGIQES